MEATHVSVLSLMNEDTRDTTRGPYMYIEKGLNTQAVQNVFDRET